MVAESTSTELKDRCLLRAIETFGDVSLAQRWMLSPIRALSNVSPSQHITQFLDDTHVIEILDRIDHGVFE